MSRPFYTLDVFTDQPLQGNPLAVVMDAEDMTGERMQAVAREFNLSETVFVLPPRNAVNSARIRIFTPARELPFAGHPTVGAAVLLAELRAPEILARQHLGIVIEEEIGLVQCTARKVAGKTRASFDLPRLPAPAGMPPSLPALAAALRLAPADIGFANHRPSQFSAGVAFSFVPVRDLEAVARAWPDLAAWDEAFGEDGAAFVYTREAVQPASAFHARMFAPGLGMMEDPATGSAVAAFAGVLQAFEAYPDGDQTVVVEQGFEMGRPSLITLGLDIAGGQLIAASIGGGAVIVSRGTLAL